MPPLRAGGAALTGTPPSQALLAERGVECKGCSEKADLVARVAETYHLPVQAQARRAARALTPRAPALTQP